MPTPLLTKDELNEALTHLPGWEVVMDGKAIRKAFRFSDFMTALDFVNQLAPIAEKDNHHPDLALGWGYVEVALTTHDSGGITAKDIQLAQAAQKL